MHCLILFIAIVHHKFMISCFALPISIFSNHLLFDFKFRSNYRCLLCVLLELDAACAHVLPLFWASTHLWGIQVFKLPCFLNCNSYPSSQFLYPFESWSNPKFDQDLNKFKTWKWKGMHGSFLVTIKWSFWEVFEISMFETQNHFSSCLTS